MAGGGGATEAELAQGRLRLHGRLLELAPSMMVVGVSRAVVAARKRGPPELAWGPADPALWPAVRALRAAKLVSWLAEGVDDVCPGGPAELMWRSRWRGYGSRQRARRGRWR